MSRRFATRLFLLCVWLSVSSFANAVTYHVAKTKSQSGLELEFIWPRDGEQCVDPATAAEALERLCDEADQPSMLLLVQVSSDGEIRTQKTLRVLKC